MNFIKLILLIIGLTIAMLIAIKVIVFTLGVLSLLIVYVLPPALVIGGIIYYMKYCR